MSLLTNILASSAPTKSNCERGASWRCSFGRAFEDRPDSDVDLSVDSR